MLLTYIIETNHRCNTKSKQQIWNIHQPSHNVPYMMIKG